MMLKEVSQYGHVLALSATSTTATGDASQVRRSRDKTVPLVITNDNFLASDPCRRPAGWMEARYQRVSARQRVRETTQGDEVDNQNKTFYERQEEEEKLMIQEVLQYGTILSIDNININSESSALTTDATESADTSSVPWTTLRSQRVNAKESVIKAKQSEPRSATAMLTSLFSSVERSRADKEKDEDLLMKTERKCYGQPLALIGTCSSSQTCITTQPRDVIINAVTYDATDLSQRPSGWFDIRNQRIQMKLKVATPSNTSKSTHLQRETAEEEIMMREIENYGVLLPYACYKPSSEEWLPLRYQRVQKKENYYRIDPKTKLLLRVARESNEEQNMLTETNVYGQTLDFDIQSFDQEAQCSPSWATLLMQRVLAKEAATPVVTDNKTLLETRAQRMEEEEVLMQYELATYGTVMSNESLGYNSINSDNNSLDARNNNNPQATTAVVMTDLILNNKTFDPTIVSKRPHGWAAVRHQRVEAKLRHNPKFAAQSVAQQQKLVAEDEDEEEQCMLKEVSLYGNALGVATRSNISLCVQASDLVFHNNNNSEDDESFHPYGWKFIQSKRMQARQQQQQPSSFTISAQLEDEEEQLMVREVKSTYGFLLNKHQSLLPSQVLINKDTFDPTVPTKRPIGWEEIKTKRILAKEYNQRKRKPSLLSQSEADLRLQGKEEESVMLTEVALYGVLLGLAGPYDEASSAAEGLDILCSKSNFNDKIADKRPPGWMDLRLRRVLASERFQRQHSGVKDDVLLDRRPQLVLDMERMMIQEVHDYGSVLGAVGKGGSVIDPLISPILKLQITMKNFDPAYGSEMRPPGWEELKQRRLELKEQMDLLVGGLNHADIQNTRLQRAKDEEKLMVDEVLRHYAAAAATAMTGASASASEWNQTRPTSMSLSQYHSSRPMSMSLSAGNRNRSSSRLTGGSSSRGADDNSRRRMSITPNIIITPETFDPNDPSKRPEGWRELRNKRVVVKEQIDRLAGVDEETIAALRDDRELEEEELMVHEVLETGSVTGGARREDRQQRDKEVKVHVDDSNFLATDITKRPVGWTELRLKRVMLKEHIDRLNGVDEATIIEFRPTREFDVCISSTIVVIIMLNNYYLVFMNMCIYPSFCLYI